MGLKIIGRPFQNAECTIKARRGEKGGGAFCFPRAGTCQYIDTGVHFVSSLFGESFSTSTPQLQKSLFGAPLRLLLLGCLILMHF